MKKEIIERLNNGLGALCFFPPPCEAEKWGREMAEEQGKRYFDYAEELGQKYPGLEGGFLAVEAAYAESKGYDLDDYWQARLNGAKEISSQSDIEEWLSRQ